MLEFRTFIENQNKKASDNALNKAERIQEYQSLVNQLYSEVDQDWLKEYIPDQIKTGLEPMTLNEVGLGDYPMPKKWIQIGNSRLYLIPAGTLLLGTNARVDLVFGARSVMIMWIDQNIKSPLDIVDNSNKSKKGSKPVFTWKMAVKNGSLHYVNVNSKSFQNIIMALLNE